MHTRERCFWLLSTLMVLHQTYSEFQCTICSTASVAWLIYMKCSAMWSSWTTLNESDSLLATSTMGWLRCKQPTRKHCRYRKKSRGKITYALTYALTACKNKLITTKVDEDTVCLMKIFLPTCAFTEISERNANQRSCRSLGVCAIFGNIEIRLDLWNLDLSGRSKFRLIIIIFLLYSLI